jgi:hypothetical protein
VDEKSCLNQVKSNERENALECTADAAAAKVVLGSEVIGFHLYSVGLGTEWSDISPCLERVP